MVFAKAHCFNCNADFELYVDDVSTASRAEHITCPHCCATMPPAASVKLYNAFMTFEEVNKTLRKAHDERGAHLFQVELRSHYVNNDTFLRGMDIDDDNRELTPKECAELCGGDPSYWE